MGGCATKPKAAEGEAPMPPLEAEKAEAGGEEGLLMTAEADPADESRRRSLGVLFKEEAEDTDQLQEETEETVTVETVSSTTTTAAVAETNQEVVEAQHECIVEERTIQEPKPEIAHNDDHSAEAVAVEEEKQCVTSDSTQELAASSEEKNGSVPASAPPSTA